MDTPQQRVATLRQEAEDFKRRLASLPAAAWEQPSACAGWTVADVAAHLAGQDFALRVSRGLQGDYSPPEGQPTVAEHNEDRFAHNIFQRAFDTRKRLGDGLRESLFQRLDEATEAFEAVGPEQWDNLCYWPPGPEPARVMLDMRISELSMHAWDVCSRFDPNYRLSDACLPVLMDTATRAARRAFRPDPALLRPLRFRFLIDRPVAAVYDLTFTAAGARLEGGVLAAGLAGPDASQDSASAAADAGSAPSPEVVFRCDGETYVMVMYGRLTPEDALAAGRLTWEGDAALAQSFGQRFKGG